MKNKNWSIVVISVLIIIFIVSVAFSAFSWIKLHNDDNLDDDNPVLPDTSKPIVYDDYIYKIRHDFGGESYIYLLPNNVIKVLQVSKIFTTQEDCNCMIPTGEYEYKEETIEFSEETKSVVIDTFKELAKKSGKNEFNTDDIDLSLMQERILLAVTLNKEDMITFDNEVSFKEEQEEIKSNNNDKKVVNKMTLLNNSSKNATLNKVADYLNEIVQNDFNKYNDDTKEILDNITDIDSLDGLGLNLKLELVSATPYNISFKYTVEGQLGTSAIYKVKGYNFHYTGDLKKFDSNGWKDGYYQKVLKEFMKDELYLNYSQDFDKDWQEKLFEEIFTTGNWYIDNEKISFIISPDCLGIDEDLTKTLIISVDLDEQF